MNKRGQFESILVAIAMLFIIGVLFFFMNHLSDALYTGFDEYFESSIDYNNSIPRDTVQEIQTIDNQVWDWAFLAIFIGYLIQMVLLSFATRISVAFYWIFGIMGLVGLAMGVMLSNMWQEIVSIPTFVDTIARFPITNALLGSYYPIVITGLLLIVMIAIFGKPQQPGALVQ